MLLERLFSIVLTIYIARVLGASTLGEYTLVLSFVVIFQILALFGQDEIIMREVSRDRSKAGLYLANSSLVAVLTSIVFLIVMNATVNLLGYEQNIVTYMYIASFSLLPGTVSLVAEAVIKAFEKMEYVTAVRFGGNLLNVIAALVLLQLGYELIAVFVLLIIVRSVMSVLYMFFITRVAGRLTFGLDLRFCRNLLGVSITFLLISVLGMVINNIGVVMLSKLEDLEALGIYAAGAKLMQGGQVFAAAYTLSVVPSMSRAFVASKERFIKIAQRSLDLFLILSIPIALGVTILADTIIFLIYGSGYEASVPVLQILIWALVLQAVNSVLYRSLVASNNEHVTLRVGSVRMIGSVLLNFLLITKYGVVGASLAWIGAMLIGLLLNYYYVSKQLLKLDIIVTTAKIFLSAIIASGGFLWLRSLEANRLGSLLLGGAIYVFVYSVLLITLRVLSRDELLLLLRQLGQRVATGSQPTLLE